MTWFGAKNTEMPSEMAGAGESGGSPPARPSHRKPKIGIAVGAGSARGWAHIGVLSELEKAGIKPDVIAGSSIGAVIGGCYAAGKLDDIEHFARGMTKRRMFTLMDFAFSGSGLISGARLKDRLEATFGGMRAEDKPLRFAAVATEMGTGHEIWLSKGNIVDAIRASYALPGIFAPMKVNGRWLFDGALVNPVPVNVCRVLGAEIVIALNVNADLRKPAVSEHAITEKALGDMQSSAEVIQDAPGLLPLLRNPASLFRRQFGAGENGAPGIAAALIDAFNITQDRIARSRLAGDPPDITISPRLTGIGFFDFHRAPEMIALGREAARKALPDIQEVLAASVV